MLAAIRIQIRLGPVSNEIAISGVPYPEGSQKALGGRTRFLLGELRLLSLNEVMKRWRAYDGLGFRN